MYVLKMRRAILLFVASLIPLLLAALILGRAAAEGLPAEPQPSAEDNPYWEITLKDLGHASLVMPDGEERPFPRLPVVFPEDASQGPDDWWILYSHFQIVIDPGSEPGIVWVNIGTNDRISNQVVIESFGQSQGFAVSRTELLNGHSRYFTLSPMQTHHMANYMQDRGIQPGVNELHFGFRSSGDVKVKELVFHGDTKIVRIPLGPPKLEFRPVVQGGVFTKHQETLVEVDLHSLGWPVQNLRMDVRYAGEAFSFRDPSPRMIKKVKTSEIISYNITPTESGTHDLVFLAEGTNLGPLEGTLSTNIKEPIGTVWPWSIIGGLYLILGFIIYSGVRRSAGGRRSLMLFIRAWSAFAWQNPRVATAVASIPFLVLALLINIYDSVIYGGGTPGTMVAAFTILYLALAVAAGITSPLRVGSVGPILAYAAITMLWPLVPGGDTYEAMEYDSGWIGAVMSGVVIPSVVIWLFVLAGNLIGGSRSNKCKKQR